MNKRMVMAIVTLLIGVGGLVFAFHVSGEIRGKKDWPTVPGKILERRVGEPTTGSRTFLPHVKYSYTVDGKHYANDQVYLIRKTGATEDKVKQLVEGLPDPVPVHYNPSNPQESFLIVNPMWWFWLIAGVAALALLWGLLQLLAWKGKR